MAARPGPTRDRRRVRPTVNGDTRRETGVDFMSVISDEARGDYANNYDAAFIFANVKGFAQEAAIRIKWSTPMAAEIPWYATAVPTVLVSLTQPNHLIDVPMFNQRPRRHQGSHSRHHPEDHGPIRVPGHLQRQRLLRLLRHAAVAATTTRRPR